MSLSTLVKFLAGDRNAILTIARTPQALWIGLLFVLGAGFARNYDKESLLNEPWHLLVGVGVSILTSFVLFNLFYWTGRFSDPRPRFGAAYRSFLQVFWMTAPMAWLYAIPWERIFDSPGDATAANLWTLALVSVWRVLLITRVLAVLFNIHMAGAFFVVMLYSTIAAIGSVVMLPFQIISAMGGVQLGEGEQLIAGIGMTIAVFGTLSVPVWLIGSLAVFGVARPRWAIANHIDAEGEPTTGPVGIGSLGRAAFVMILGGLALLPLTQPEQMRRHKAESLLESGEIDAAIAYMSEHEPSDFPPHWNPPPRPGYVDRRPDLHDVAQRIINVGAAEWVRETYAAKLHAQVHRFGRSSRETWAEHAERGVDGDSLWWLNSNDTATLELILTLDISLPEEDRVALAVIIEFLRDEEAERKRAADSP